MGLRLLGRPTCLCDSAVDPLISWYFFLLFCDIFLWSTSVLPIRCHFNETELFLGHPNLLPTSSHPGHRLCYAIVLALINIWNNHIRFFFFLVLFSLVCKFFWTGTLFFTTRYLAENNTWYFVRNQLIFVKWMMKQNLYILQFALILSVVENGVCTFFLFLLVER